MLLYRLLGLAVAASGAALLLFLSYALYTRADAGQAFLVHIGMPAALLATLFGSFVVGFGVWLAGFAHPSHDRRAPPSSSRR